ncbi:ABC transporter C-terminal domain-containing protein, partial [Thermoleptolyngbya sp. M55_K2018_002]|uniref:ABC transporter C-terminal domain-containing protein n=1 Tax=Thermoleptolyngbya sp. M55_K2018_002 TaxID=2747808 RepID=UPI0019FF8957
KAAAKAEPKVASNAEPQPTGGSPPSPTATKPRKLSFKEKREYETLETRIPALEAEREQLEQRLYGDSPADFTEMQHLTEKLASLTAEIDAATERWLELAELAD